MVVTKQNLGNLDWLPPNEIDNRIFFLCSEQFKWVNVKMGNRYMYEKMVKPKLNKTEKSSRTQGCAIQVIA